MRGLPNDPEKRDAWRKANIGRVRSAETRARVSAAKTRHGHAGMRSQTYNSWAGMLNRCTNPNATRWNYYGGRGITVCVRWRDFENFLKDMGTRPEGHTLDRIDPNGNYEPGNCRWATWHDQRVNRRPIGSQRE